MGNAAVLCTISKSARTVCRIELDTFTAPYFKACEVYMKQKINHKKI
jgi:hypothetical protein